MSYTASPTGVGGVAASPTSQRIEPTELSGWVGWIAFAGFMLVMVGTFHIFQGLIALFAHEYFLVGQNGMSIHVNFTTWGWIQLIGGIIVVAAGVGMFSGKPWARAVGVLVAMVSAIVNVGFLAAYPIWSIMMIGIDILVIWALIVHGRELRE